MKKIKFATPDVSSLECRKVTNAIETRWLTNGPVVREFENRVKEISRCPHAVCLDSCSNAMELTLRLLGIGPGDEVITTPFTYTATADAIYHTGAKIVFVDLNGANFEMNYDRMIGAITEHTKAVMPVDYGGKICNYAALYSAIDQKKCFFKPSSPIQEALGRIAVVADAAHSFNATQGDKVSGELADFTCFSFHVLKNITTGGEGGAVVWNDIPGIDNGEVELRLRLLADHGQTTRDKSGGWEYDIALLGHNSIMTNLDAAMGIAQLDRLDELTQKRIEITHNYDVMFSDYWSTGARPMLQHFGPDYTSAMYLYPVYLHISKYRSGADRDSIYRRLKERGVPCNVHYKPLPMMTAYKQLGYSIDDYPMSFVTFRNMLTIPYHTELKIEDQEYIVRMITKAVNE